MLSATVGCDEDREGDHWASELHDRRLYYSVLVLVVVVVTNSSSCSRTSELHGGRGAHQASNSRKRSVLSHWREKSVFTGRNASDTRRAVQQSWDCSDVPVSQPHHRAASRHLVLVSHVTQVRRYHDDDDDYCCCCCCCCCCYYYSYHVISCQCADCVTKQNYDSLKRLLSQHTVRASPSQQ